ncbi:MAG TPA: ATP-binding protein, partial [Candidatus Cloacimonadota bacterium]|nr:ATP-binding protein [Candidatus Cloacimonadota bacterium]
DLDEALKACIRAKNLISKILSFSRSTEQEVQSISLADVLTESLPMIRASIPTIISINTEISSYRDVLADPTEIQQILLNLSTNSFHAMQKKGGVLSFKIKELSGFELIGLDPAVKLNQDYLQLSVEDTGCGIPAEMLPRIFDPYFSTKSTGEGTGLGLAIVHGIVKNAGGFISVQSEVEVGTVFNLYFPIVEAVRPQKNQPKIINPPFNPAHILFVDDEQALTELFSEALCSEGYTVEITSDSEVALELFRANPEKYNLIIADVTMPHLDGIKLAGLIREINNVPIILYSGYSVYNLRTEIHEIGVNRLLSKPILPMDMVTSVREVMAEVKFNQDVVIDRRFNAE